MSFEGFLKQSTAVTVMIGPVVSATDGDTATTGATITSGDIRLSKNAGNMAAKNESTSCTHDEEGMFTCLLDATDTNTVGILKLIEHESGSLHVVQTYYVLEEAIYDSLFAASATAFDSNADVTVGGLATAAKAEVESECNDALVAQKLDHLVAVADSDDPVDGSIIASMASTTADWSTFVEGTDALQAVRDQLVITDAVADAIGVQTTAINSNVVSVLADTAVIGSAGVGLTAVGLATGAVDADALATDAVNEIADGLLDRADGVEPASAGTERTVRESLRIILSSLAGKLSGAGTTTVSIRDTNDSKNRISATVDASGNRSAVTLTDT